MHHLSPHPDTATDHTKRTPDSPDTPAVTSNTASPANDTSISNINMSKWGNLTGNKTTQQTKKIDTNSTSNQEITSEETKNLLQK